MTTDAPNVVISRLDRIKKRTTLLRAMLKEWSATPANQRGTTPRKIRLGRAAAKRKSRSIRTLRNRKRRAGVKALQISRRKAGRNQRTGAR